MHRPTGDADSVDLKESFYRVYLHWAPSTNIAMNVQYQRQFFARDTTFSMRTHLIPIEFRYFQNSGLMAGADLVVANQDVHDIDNNGSPLVGGDTFVVVNAGLGYRLPKRYGIIRFSVNNILNENFDFQGIDAKWTPQLIQVHPFLPTRTLFAQITLAF